MNNRERMFACIRAPAISLQSVVRSEPGLRESPVVTAEGKGGAARIVHVSAAARKLGIRIGMTSSQARSTAPEIMVRQPSPEVVAAAARALLDCAASFSQTIQDDSDGKVILDVTGHQDRYGGFSRMGGEIIRAAATDGLIVRVGFAPGAALARIASRCTGSVAMAGPMAGAIDIGAMPVAVLEPSTALLGMLGRLRIETVGKLAALHGPSVGSRLGPEGIRLHALARGIDDSVITRPLVPDDRFIECVRLDWTLDNLEPLMFLLKAAADRISGRMQRRGLCPGKASLTLELDGTGLHVIETGSGRLSSGPVAISSILYRALTRNPPPDAVRGFTLIIAADRAKAVQCQLFGPPVIEPGRVRELTGRLVAIAGEENVGSPEVSETPGRDRSSMTTFNPSIATAPRTDRQKSRRDRPPSLALRRLRQPYDATIEKSGELPSAISSKLVSGRVCRVAGPWYLDASWWTETPQAGALYDIEIQGRGLFRLWHDLLDDKWFVDGIWD